MEMIEPAIFRALTQSIPNYPANYTYESTAHVRLSRIPWIGKYLRGVFNFVWPGWEEAVNWTLLVERESFAALVASTVLFSFTLAIWLILKLYFMRTLPIFIQRPDHTSSVDPSPKFFR
jgi:hypothetical protein